jgi:hypothetical protein
VSVRKAEPGERHGDVWVDVRRSMEVYREWKALARSARTHSPDGNRRPLWLKRPLRPVEEVYRLPEEAPVGAGASPGGSARAEGGQAPTGG